MRTIIALAVCCGCLIACGQKGPLYLPQDESLDAAAAQAAVPPPADSAPSDNSDDTP